MSFRRLSSLGFTEMEVSPLAAWCQNQVPERFVTDPAGQWSLRWHNLVCGR